MAINFNANYTPNVNPPDTDYTYGSAKNVTTPGDGTGTPLDKVWINDILGFLQYTLKKGSVSISGAGTPDTVNQSDYHDAMRLSCGYPGLIVPLGLNADPATFAGLRILLLDGSGVLTAAYPSLVTNTYVGNTLNATADCFYRASDPAGAIRATAGNYFILPDMRGRFLRGLDTGALRDVDGSGRITGSYQVPSIDEHKHFVSDDGGTTNNLNINSLEIDYPNTSDNTNYFLRPVAGNIGPAISADTVIPTSMTGDSAIKAETRPYNMAVNWGIWY